MNATTAVSILAIVVAFVFSMLTQWRVSKKDSASSIEQTTTVIVKLENISAGISEIKADMRSAREDIKNHETRIVKLEERDKSMWKTINDIKGEKL